MVTVMMFSKLVFLVLGSIALANALQITPDDLKEYFNEIEAYVRDQQRQAALQIGGNWIKLDVLIEQAKEIIQQNLTDAAQPYWDTIEALQKEANETGQNITDCVDYGNNKLYAFNQTIVYQANAAFDYYNYSGIRLINNASSIEAYSVILELAVISDVIFTCKNDTCAGSWKTIIGEYYDRVQTTLKDAQAKASNYVNLYLPPLLTLYPFNTDLYVSTYTDILSDITNCINSTITTTIPPTTV